MGIEIKPMELRDRIIIEDWCKKTGYPTPSEGIIPYGSTFIAEIDNVPAVTMSLYLSNVETAHLEALIGNPSLAGQKRREATKALFDYMFRFAKELGYKRVWIMAPNEKLKAFYEKIGFMDSGFRTFVLTREM